jgi:hypothetical protein
MSSGSPLVLCGIIRAAVGKVPLSFVKFLVKMRCRTFALPSESVRLQHFHGFNMKS